MCVAWAVVIATLQVGNLGLYWFCERLNAPWLPWFRRYLSVWFLVPTMLIPARWPAFWVLTVAAVSVANWNAVTARNNRKGGRKGKPFPSLSAGLTLVQVGVMRREARACR
jgi:hypothetical protein